MSFIPALYSANSFSIVRLSSIIFSTTPPVVNSNPSTFKFFPSTSRSLSFNLISVARCFSVNEVNSTCSLSFSSDSDLSCSGISFISTLCSSNSFSILCLSSVSFSTALSTFNCNSSASTAFPSISRSLSLNLISVAWCFSVNDVRRSPAEVSSTCSCSFSSVSDLSCSVFPVLYSSNSFSIICLSSCSCSHIPPTLSIISCKTPFWWISLSKLSCRTREEACSSRSSFCAWSKFTSLMFRIKLSFSSRNLSFSCCTRATSASLSCITVLKENLIESFSAFRVSYAVCRPVAWLKRSSTVTWFDCSASSYGVRPSWFLTPDATPVQLNSKCTTSSWPKRAAWCNAVFPKQSCWLTSKPGSPQSRLTTSTSPRLAAEVRPDIFTLRHRECVCGGDSARFLFPSLTPWR